MRWTGILLAGLVLLAGCGNDRSDGLTGTALAGLRQVFQRGEGAAELRSSLTPAVLAQIRDPLMYVEIPDMGAAAVMQIFGRNQGHVTWQTANDVSFSFLSGVLNATRGLGNDLMASDIADTAAWVAGGGGDGAGFRIHRYLDGENQLVIRSFRCTYRTEGWQVVNIFGTNREARLLVETCGATDLEIENRFWLGADGIIWKSRQWVSSEVGYLDSERLVP